MFIVNLTYQNRNHVIVKYPLFLSGQFFNFFPRVRTYFAMYFCICLHIIGKQTETDFNSITENITYSKLSKYELFRKNTKKYIVPKKCTCCFFKNTFFFTFFSPPFQNPIIANDTEVAEC